MHRLADLESSRSSRGRADDTACVLQHVREHVSAPGVVVDDEDAAKPRSLHVTPEPTRSTLPPLTRPFERIRPCPARTCPDGEYRGTVCPSVNRTESVSGWEKNFVGFVETWPSRQVQGQVRVITCRGAVRPPSSGASSLIRAVLAGLRAGRPGFDWWRPA